MPGFCTNGPPPPRYRTRRTRFNFAVRMGSGAFLVVWSYPMLSASILPLVSLDHRLSHRLTSLLFLPTSQEEPPVVARSSRRCNESCSRQAAGARSLCLYWLLELRQIRRETIGTHSSCAAAAAAAVAGASSASTSCSCCQSD